MTAKQPSWNRFEAAILLEAPAIDIRQKQAKGLFGRKKLVYRSKKEQRLIKQELMKQYPDRYYVDDLNEWNSIRGKDADLAWIDEIEAIDALFSD